jgi:hypothetical protein
LRSPADAEVIARVAEARTAASVDFYDRFGGLWSIASIRFARQRPFGQLFMLAGVADP